MKTTRRAPQKREVTSRQGRPLNGRQKRRRYSTREREATATWLRSRDHWLYAAGIPMRSAAALCSQHLGRCVTAQFVGRVAARVRAQFRTLYTGTLNAQPQTTALDPAQWNKLVVALRLLKNSGQLHGSDEFIARRLQGGITVYPTVSGLENTMDCGRTIDPLAWASPAVVREARQLVK